MIFPECRHDEYYNSDFLEERDYEFVRGFDWATEAVDTLFENSDDNLTDGSDYIEKFLNEKLPESMQDEYDMDFAFQEQKTEHRDVKTYGDLLHMKILEWLEKERNELIVSMIENMNEDIYNAIRNKVLQENTQADQPKEYYDTRTAIFNS